MGFAIDTRGRPIAIPSEQTPRVAKLQAAAGVRAADDAGVEAMWAWSKLRLDSQVMDPERFDVRLVRHQFTDATRLIWGVDATYQSKYTRHNVPHPAYFRFRQVHPRFYQKVKIGKGTFIDKYADRNKIKP